LTLGQRPKRRLSRLHAQTATPRLSPTLINTTTPTRDGARTWCRHREG